MYFGPLNRMHGVPKPKKCHIFFRDVFHVKNRFFGVFLYTFIGNENELYRRYNKYPSPELRTLFKSTCKNIKYKCRNLKNAYLHNSILNATSSSDVWSTLRNAGLTKKSNTNASTFFNKHTLNSHYCRISSLHPPCSLQQLTQLFNQQADTTTQFFFHPVTEEFVRNKFVTLAHKANNLSPDSLPLKYLINIIDTILSPLTQIFNSALSQSIYPQIWKSAFIIPLNKIPKPISTNDTRPISNLSHLAKIFDSIITNQLSTYLE